jgi:hypothetical protein
MEVDDEDKIGEVDGACAMGLRRLHLIPVMVSTPCAWGTTLRWRSERERGVRMRERDSTESGGELVEEEEE